jgi:uroporphyrinogen-III synthase
VLAATLARRGARVERADVYRRDALTPSPARLRALARLPARTALLVSSAEAFAVLWAALDEDGRAALVRRPAVAGSERLATRLRNHGFERVTIAAGARPRALVTALSRDVRIK